MTKVTKTEETENTPAPRAEDAPTGRGRGRPPGTRAVQLANAGNVLRQTSKIYNAARQSWLESGSKLQPDQVRALCAVLDLALRARELVLVEDHVKDLETRLGAENTTLDWRTKNSQCDVIDMKVLEGQGLPRA